MEFWSRLRKVALAVLDAALVNLAVMTALYLRFEGSVPRHYIETCIKVAPYFTVASVALFAVLGLYSWILRYASIDAMLASAFGAVGSAGSLWALTRGWADRSFPRSVPIIAGVLVFILVGGLRVSVRLFLRLERRAQSLLDRRDAIRVLVVGAGDAGSILGRELSKPATPRRVLVGYIDDDPAKKGSILHGARVLGPRRLIPSVVEEKRVQEVIIAMPSAPPQVTRQIVEMCQGLGVKIRSMPRLSDLAKKTFDLDMVKEVEIEDLLGRPEVRLDTEKIREYLTGKTVLVTGAGGSIGSEICRQVAGFGPSRLVMLGHGEGPIFTTKLSLEREFPGISLEAVIADVRDSARIRDVLASHRPTVVFHAAAHKHVPFMEENITEAIKTNVFGTLNVARAARLYGADKFVMISTDKAVNPSSVMGVSKRIAEIIVSSMNGPGSHTKFVSVRFGNVLGSSGSVVTIFREQIARGGPVTVTHPQMKRYFMTVREAVQLVLQAGTMGHGGEVFVLDMGKPVRIVDLAEQMIRLSGRAPYTEVPIVFSGIRPGEKLFEELLTAQEGATATSHSQIFVARQDGLEKSALYRGLALLEAEVFPRDYECRLFDRDNVAAAEDAASEVAKGLSEVAPAAGGDASDPGGFGIWGGQYWREGCDQQVLKSREQEILRLLKVLVPEYNPAVNGSAEEEAGGSVGV